MQNSTIFNSLFGTLLLIVLVLLLSFQLIDYSEEIALENNSEIELVEDLQEKDAEEEFLHLNFLFVKKLSQSKIHTSASEFHYMYAIKTIFKTIVSPPPRCLYS